MNKYIIVDRASISNTSAYTIHVFDTIMTVSDFEKLQLSLIDDRENFDKFKWSYIDYFESGTIEADSIEDAFDVYECEYECEYRHECEYTQICECKKHIHR